MERVLIIDDDRELCDILKQYLAIEHFEVTGVHDGEGGVEAALSGEYALVLLDVMLPGFNGFEVLRRVRAAPTPASRVPVLMLTARGDAMDRIVGLEVGADDYLPKPFNERELVARIRAILRRAPRAAHASSEQAAKSNPESERLRVGDVELEVGERRVLRGGQDVELTAVEFDLLTLLMRQAGKVVSRQEIARQVLDRQLLPFDRSIDTHISNLRRKLGPHAGSERIKTVRSVGYIYVLAPRLRAEPSA